LGPLHRLPKTQECEKIIGTVNFTTKFSYQNSPHNIRLNQRDIRMMFFLLRIFDKTILLPNLSLSTILLSWYDVVQDIWDSIQNNEYFSFEGLVEVFKQVTCHQSTLFFIYQSIIWSWPFDFTQLRYYKTPDIETPNYLVLKKTANYEVLIFSIYSITNPVYSRLE
jgi:hypothetical protein